MARRAPGRRTKGRLTMPSQVPGSVGFGVADPPGGRSVQIGPPVRERAMSDEVGAT